MDPLGADSAPQSPSCRSLLPPKIPEGDQSPRLWQECSDEGWWWLLGTDREQGPLRTMETLC